MMNINMLVFIGKIYLRRIAVQNLFFLVFKPGLPQTLRFFFWNWPDSFFCYFTGTTFLPNIFRGFLLLFWTNILLIFFWLFWPNMLHNFLAFLANILHRFFLAFSANILHKTFFGFFVPIFIPRIFFLIHKMSKQFRLKAKKIYCNIF